MKPPRAEGIRDAVNHLTGHNPVLTVTAYSIIIFASMMGMGVVINLWNGRRGLDAIPGYSMVTNQLQDGLVGEGEATEAAGVKAPLIQSN